MHLPPSAARALIFDCDGLLVDTQPCWDTTFRETAGEFGLDLASDDLRQMRGYSVAGAAAFIVERTATAGGPERVLVEHRILARLLAAIEASDLRPLPGVEATLHRHASLPRAVASNAPRQVLEQVLHRLKLDRTFKVVLSADDVPAPKPAPDSYLLACARLGVAPLRAIALEDSLAGIRSAMAAGLSVMAVTALTQETPADITVSSLEDEAARAWLDKRVAGL